MTEQPETTARYCIVAIQEDGGVVRSWRATLRRLVLVGEDPEAAPHTVELVSRDPLFAFDPRAAFEISIRRASDGE